MMVPWRLQKRFFQPGHSVSTPVPLESEVLEKKLEKKMKKAGRKPKKGKVNNPPLSVWRDVGTEDEISMAAMSNQLEAEHLSDVAEGVEEEETEGALEGEREGDAAVAQVEVEVEVEEEISPEGRCEHVVEEGNQLLFQRYCHVYEKGELEDLCSWYVMPSLLCSVKLPISPSLSLLFLLFVDVYSPFLTCLFLLFIILRTLPLSNLVFILITTLPPPTYSLLLHPHTIHIFLHSIPNCQIIETGWDKGNWTVLLEKTEDKRLTPGLTQMGPESCTPVLHVRK
jgi:hypothetical protein